MNLNQGWLGELFELQRKAAELTKNNNPTADVQGMVLELLQKWGLEDPFLNGGLNSLNSIWSKGAPAAKAVDRNTDVTESQNTVRVRLFIPGVAAESDLRIELRDGSLHISGKTGSRADNDGSFSQQVPLPAPVTAADATAVYESGQLTVALPKTPPASGVAIPLQRFVPDR